MEKTVEYKILKIEESIGKTENLKALAVDFFRIEGSIVNKATCVVRKNAAVNLANML